MSSGGNLPPFILVSRYLSPLLFSPLTQDTPFPLWFPNYNSTPSTFCPSVVCCTSLFPVQLPSSSRVPPQTPRTPLCFTLTDVPECIAGNGGVGRTEGQNTRDRTLSKGERETDRQRGLSDTLIWCMCPIYHCRNISEVIILSLGLKGDES